MARSAGTSKKRTMATNHIYAVRVHCDSTSHGIGISPHLWVGQEWRSHCVFQRRAGPLPRLHVESTRSDLISRNIILTTSTLEARRDILVRDSGRAATVDSAQRHSATYRLAPAPETAPTTPAVKPQTLIPAGRRRNAAQIAPT